VAIVQTAGGLRAFTEPRAASTSLGFVGALGYLDTGYAALYSSQPNIRKCVDFLARNMAQLGIHAFRRVSDTDRERLVNHEVIRWLSDPRQPKSRYRLIEDLMGDMGLYFNAVWAKVRGQFEDGTKKITLVRLPPGEITVKGLLLPTSYEWAGIPFTPADVVAFTGYNPINPLLGLSPLETLKDLLENDIAATANRTAYWQNSARIEGIIERPKAAGKWTPEQKQQFREQWQGRFAGPGNAGMTPILEDDMTWKPSSFSSRDSEYNLSRKLTAEECAGLYHIPLPLVGLLDHATFSNIREQHKQLYADTLGPWCEMIIEELERQLLPEASDTADVYLEFNIADKLKGSFEEQAGALHALVGRPLMTPNEGRARLNLPAITDDPTADEIAAQQGIAAPPVDGAPVDAGTGSSAARVLPFQSASSSSSARIDAPSRAVEAIVRSTWARQAARLGKLPTGQQAGRLDHERGVRELAADLAPLMGDRAAGAYAARVTTETYGLLQAGADAFSRSREVPPCQIG
jgi:HK97 family phage portal protein